MWRLGFALWRLLIAAKYGAPTLAVLALIYHAQGPSLLFWATATLAGCVGLGLWLGVRELSLRELGTTGSIGRRRR
jgi:hypothetical protein